MAWVDLEADITDLFGDIRLGRAELPTARDVGQTRADRCPTCGLKPGEHERFGCRFLRPDWPILARRMADAANARRRAKAVPI